MYVVETYEKRHPMVEANKDKKFLPCCRKMRAMHMARKSETRNDGRYKMNAEMGTVKAWL